MSDATHYAKNFWPKNSDKIHDLFIGIGFSEEEIAHQLGELGEAIILQATANLLTKKPPTSQFKSETEAMIYLRNNFSKEEVNTALEREGEKVIEGYIKSISYRSHS